ncbi:MAG: efflux RND transporter periplasmic adaptor subunit [Desulfobulbaceae bacterium]|nr:efflux RND transporter periplasmic adaptor subunit [Desulfobulbaceae bacterium]
MDEKKSSGKGLGWIARIILIVIILALSIAGASYMLTHRPKAKRKPRAVQPPLVKTMKAIPADHRVTIQTLGTIVPSQKVDLAARVSGEIIYQSPHFFPGGHFAAHDLILEIDPLDYELALEQRQSDVAKASNDLKLEMGKQSIARREYDLLGETIEKQEEELVLRAPQLKASRAALKAAQASLEQARLNLERTRIAAPFNALVDEKNVALGSQVSVGSTLATLIDTDEYWIEASVPLDRLGSIKIPGKKSENASAVRISHPTAWGENAFRTGVVKSLLPGVDTESRMARLLISVKDPLCLLKSCHDLPQLTLNTYVRLEIEATPLHSAYAVPRPALHEGNHIWVMTEHKTLDIKQVDILWEDEEKIYIPGGSMTQGEHLITSDIAAPVQAMQLRRQENTMGLQH